MTTLYHGNFVHCIDKDTLKILENTAIQVDNLSGKILFIHEGIPINQLDTLKNTLNNLTDIVTFDSTHLILPGFIDTHTHAPQFPNMGNGMDVELLDWLSKYTFPTEISFQDINVAKSIYPAKIRRLLNNGTTTALYYCTTHVNSTLIFADFIHQFGQRAFIGKVNMDRECPIELMEKSDDESINSTIQVIEYIHSLNSSLIKPIITPRFAISCTSNLLKKLSQLAKSYNPPLHIQTHISENKSEINHTLDLFQGYQSYTEIYKNHGILTPRTILAHAIHISDEEREIIINSGSSISHCPNSNLNLMSGICQVRKWWLAGAKVGLGTDISGGCNPSMLDAMRLASQSSRIITFLNSNLKPLNLIEIFFLATLGGAQVCNIDNIVGNFQIGKEFDAIIVDLGSPIEKDGKITNDKGLDYQISDSILSKLEKFIFIGTERNISRVYVKGKLVGGIDYSNK